MSKELLYRLNGNTNGRLKKYLDSSKYPINIAWYPSAGKDFRPMFFYPKNILKLTLLL